tara:strand:+ start:209 stop:451 length:243 start_codon:yes stop_codon:yes gene_type:complete
MKTSEAIKYFGNTNAGLARAFAAHGEHLSQQAVGKWGENLPPLRVYQLKEILAVRELEIKEREDDIKKARKTLDNIIAGK